jgi:TonB family protein
MLAPDVFGTLAALVIVLLAGGASAQEPAPDEREERAEAPPAGDGGTPAPAVVAPALVEFAEATYPPEAEAARIEGAVELLITIGADGTVTDAEVATPAGHGFDEAAVEAARRFRFTPALVNGQAIPSRIRYRYVFELREPEPAVEEPPVEAAPTVGRIAGRVLAAEDGEPLGYLTVTLSGDALSAPRTAVTGEDGAFLFAELPPGAYRVRVDGDGLGSMDATEEVAAGEETGVLYRLAIAEAPADEAVQFSARAVVDAPPREVTRRTIPREVLTRIPGTRGDALRAIELMPGVGRPAFGAGQIIVRGAAPGDSEVLLEGIPVPLLYHFGGLTSFFNSRLLDRIDFYPGNFSARYGRHTGGILDVGVRDPATDRFHGVAEFGVIDASILAEGPITPKLSVGASVRRSLIDLAFGAIADSADFQVTNAPVYYDYQAIISYRPTSRDTIRLMTYGSSDRFRLVLNEATGSDPAVHGSAGLSTRFHYTQLTWKRQFNDRARQDINFSVGPTKLHFNLGEDLFFHGDFIDTSLRSEWHFQLLPAMELIVGVDARLIPFDVGYGGPPPRQTEGSAMGQEYLEGQEQVELHIKGVVARPALFVEMGFDLGDLRLVFGGRLDYFSDLRAVTFDPRLAAHYAVTDRLSLKAGIGLFSQPPDFQESHAPLGNPNLLPNRSTHISAGGDYRIADGISVGLEGFYKYLWHRSVSTRGAVPPFFESAGVGRIYGAELAGRIEPRGRPFFGYLSYTLMRSERQDHPGDPWRLFDFDQTHIFTLAYVHKLPRNWELGGTLRIVSGNPYTPIVDGASQITYGVYMPISGMVNSARNPLFNRLDVRVEKKWVFQSWRLALFLDIQNVYNHQNQEGLIYNFNYRQSTPISGLPIIPALGLRGEM